MTWPLTFTLPILIGPRFRSMVVITSCIVMLLAGLNQNVIAANVGPLFVAQARSVSVTNCVRQATAVCAIFLQLTSPSLAFWCKEATL